MSHSKQPDVIVIGAGGAMGAATCDALARRGIRVLGLERFDIAHDRGSSHGQTRLIRRAYFEHPDYIPLIDRAYDQWEALELDMEEELLVRSGLVIAGLPDQAVIHGVQRAAAVHGLAIEQIDATHFHPRFKGFCIDDDMIALWEPHAGMLWVESCVAALASRARRHGAEFRCGCTVQALDGQGASVVVHTADGPVSAEAVVVCCGAWTSAVLPELPVPLVVRRQPQIWCACEDPLYALDSGCPAFGLQDRAGDFLYSFPVSDPRGMKIGIHTQGQVLEDPDTLDRELQAADRALIERFVRTSMPGVSRHVTDYSVCMYTMTPDEHFIVDHYPGNDNICLAAGLSGHGFKFAPVIGEAMADLVTTGATTLPIGFFGLNRFT